MSYPGLKPSGTLTRFVTYFNWPGSVTLAEAFPLTSFARFRFQCEFFGSPGGDPATPLDGGASITAVMTDGVTDTSLWGPVDVTGVSEIIIPGAYPVGGPNKVKFIFTSAGAVTVGAGRILMDHYFTING